MIGPLHPHQVMYDMSSSSYRRAASSTDRIGSLMYTVSLMHTISWMYAVCRPTLGGVLRHTQMDKQVCRTESLHVSHVSYMYESCSCLVYPASVSYRILSQVYRYKLPNRRIPIEVA